MGICFNKYKTHYEEHGNPHAFPLLIGVPLVNPSDGDFPNGRRCLSETYEQAWGLARIDKHVRRSVGYVGSNGEHFRVTGRMVGTMACMTYKLNPGVALIKCPVVLRFPKGEHRRFASGLDAAEAELDKHYVISGITVDNGKILLELEEAGMPQMNWAGEEA
ncbi:MAG: hypothetical protein IJU05_00855, partial [Schwartzia sp.]|nr:hypothetical protein [Schwartzia sp. (in: firmicutes)]